MDANLWELLVDKAIRKTKSKGLLWSTTDRGPDNTRSYETAIDENTTLSIWGYERNYSYELCLDKRMEGGSFEERKRVTVKKNAQGIDFSGLFKAVQDQISSAVRERAFNAVVQYLSNPKGIDSEKESELYECMDALGDRDYFLYSQDEEILSLVRDLTATGSIAWKLQADDDRDGQYFHADIGQDDEKGILGLYVSLLAVPASSKAGATIYTFGLMNEGIFDVEMTIDARNKRAPRLWKIANEIHVTVSKKAREDDVEFRKIVRNNIVHDILASLDRPS
ncbi:hypothetical protein [Arthrobacter sp. PAMC25284]|uniref:hypothetical protein n=1 Tax=Arthrobacter sp. PAMC25284 TaxID=2861279 RepID=UPI001C63786C|nr:hypothetical protein [Arthrobacter sp. PAMC25284]QYF91078.1 hypothetical protein KY499_07780 [Arthrobacter sp. PAMC25284]